MIPIPEELTTDARERLQKIRDLADFGLSSDRAFGDTPRNREWMRSILQAFGGIMEECRVIEPRLTEFSDSSKLLSVTEIAEASGVSRETIYKRRARK